MGLQLDKISGCPGVQAPNNSQYVPRFDTAKDPLGGKGREARNVGGVQQPAGVCFTGALDGTNL